VTDYNFGTLIRTDASEEYTQFNTTFGESRWGRRGAARAD